MIKDIKDLQIISRIARDGLSVDTAKQKGLEGEYELISLSVTRRTYLAIGRNVYVVKLKKQ